MKIQKIQLLWSNEAAKLIITLLFLFILSMNFSFFFLNTKSHFVNSHVLVCIKYSTIRSAIIFFCRNTIFSLKLLFLQDFFFFFFFYRAANASQFTYSTYVLDSSPSSVNASRLGFLICSIKIIVLLLFLISLSIVCFVYLITRTEFFN